MFKAYLGDGLYAEFDGHMLTLKANDGDDTVYLEPDVFEELLRRMRMWKNEPAPAGGEARP